MLVQAGADIEPRGGGASGFHDKSAMDLAEAHGRDDRMAILRAAPQC